MKSTRIIYDLMGIGIGPFNLGLAALTSNTSNLKTLFIDSNENFSWHPGLMLDDARMQVPFYADLVTMADPCNRFSYFSFLKARGRMFRFAIQEQHFPLRREYNEYCQWVAAQLSSLQFNTTCTRVSKSRKGNFYIIAVSTKSSHKIKTYRARNIVIGIGTTPYLPDCARDQQHPMLLHSSDYLFKKSSIKKGSDITIIGSGQSAAEIYYDLLREEGRWRSLHWYTKDDRFFPMDYSSFSLEMTSPDYINYFFSLPASQKAKLLAGQDNLYKGINHTLISSIYEQLYNRSLEPAGATTALFPHWELTGIALPGNGKINLRLQHLPNQKEVLRVSDTVILATGYRQRVPGFLQPLNKHINYTEEGQYEVSKNYCIDNQNSIFVQNADLYSHGFNSADLGMGPYRNAIILNTMLGRQLFDLEKNIAFQQFFPW